MMIFHYITAAVSEKKGMELNLRIFQMLGLHAGQEGTFEQGEVQGVHGCLVFQMRTFDGVLQAERERRVL